jgi:hypothetical protein
MAVKRIRRVTVPPKLVFLFSSPLSTFKMKGLLNISKMYIINIFIIKVFFKLKYNFLKSKNKKLFKKIFIFFYIKLLNNLVYKFIVLMSFIFNI